MNILIAQFVTPFRKIQNLKNQFHPQISDLNELDEVVNITLGIFQVIVINQLAIEKSTDFILYQKFANSQILQLNVQKLVTRSTDSFMQVRVDIHKNNTCPP